MSFRNNATALFITDEMLELVKGLEPTVFGEIARQVEEPNSRGWAQAGAAMAFLAVKNTLEYMKILASTAIEDQTKPENSN